MEDFIFSLMVVVVGAAIHAAFLRRHLPSEGQLLTACFAMHIASGIGQVLITRYYYGYGDMLLYYEQGVPIADALRSDFGSIAPELLKTFMQREDAALPFEMQGSGSSLSMGSAAAGILFLVGNSLYAASLLFSVASYVSQVLLAQALRPFFRVDQHRWVLIGALLLPSAAFWSSGMLKEPIVMATLGPMVLALQLFATKRRTVAAALLLAATGLVMAMIKPYVLMAVSVAAGVFYSWTRLTSRDNVALKPFAIVTAVVLSIGGLVAGSRFFSRADVSMTEQFALQRQNGYGVEGGSNFSLEDQSPDRPGTFQERSLAQELALVPIALVTALFRPFIFEARNAVQLATALETTVLLVLVFQTIRRRSLGAIVTQVRGSPVLVFCAMFTLALAVGTGLASTNMGTLARYRAPMSPFFFILILTTWSEGRKVTRGAVAARPSQARLA